MMPDELPCDGCGAVANERCLPGCCGYAGMLDDLEARLSGLHDADGLIGRAMTVQASKLYALLHYSSEAAGR